MLASIVSAVFPPEPATTAFTSEDLAIELTERGHRVTVYAPFPNRPTGVLVDGYKRQWRAIRHRDGFQVVHTWHTLSADSTARSRAIENLSFGVTSSCQLWLDELPDVVYLNSWPVIAQGLNIEICDRRGVPVVCSVQDIYPESLQGKLHSVSQAVLWRGMLALDAYNLKRCALVTTISSGMRKHLLATRGLDPDRVVYTPNWMEGSRFRNAGEAGRRFRDNLDVAAHTLLAIFAGSVTLSAGLELYLETAFRLRDRSDILLLIVGDGSRRAWMERESVIRGLKNIRNIYPLQPEEVPGVQAAADVLLMSLGAVAGQSAVPSKQLAYMMSGRAVIANVSTDSESARIIRAAKCGWVLPPNDADALAKKLVRLVDQRAALAECGSNARQYALQHFDRATALPRLADLVERASGA